jgi:uncharacterized protein
MLRGPQLFLGNVMHRRLRPADNTFVYPVFYCQLPVNDLAAANGPLFAVDRWQVLSLRSADHGPRDGSPLLPWIRQVLADRGLPNDGEIRLQCFPRLLGYVFNPVSFWFCHDRAGQLIAVLAEVNNTFGGHHNYLLHHPDGSPIVDGEVMSSSKVFHVSPFCEVVGSYRFRFRLSGTHQVVHIDYADGEGDLLLTAIAGKATGWGSARQLSALLRMPFLTFGVIARIHWQALRLWLKGVPFHGKTVPQPLQESPK